MALNLLRIIMTDVKQSQVTQRFLDIVICFKLKYIN
jgi:hypothetical protein